MQGGWRTQIPQNVQDRRWVSLRFTQNGAAGASRSDDLGHKGVTAAVPGADGRQGRSRSPRIVDEAARTNRRGS